MGATLSSLKQKQSYFLGTAETNLYTEDKRTDAINQAIEDFLLQYDIPQYTIPSSLTFTGGIASFPTDCLRPMKLFDVHNYEYDEVDFDKFSENRIGTYTIYYDTNTETEKITIYPTVSLSLTFWYVQQHTALSDPTDTYRMKSWWDRAVAARSAEVLLLNSRNYSSAQGMGKQAEDLIAKAWQSERNRLTGKQDQRLTSIFAKRPLLFAFRTNNVNTISTVITGFVWETITDIAHQGEVAHGYFTDNASRVTITLPVIVNIGDEIEVVGQGIGGWKLAQNLDQIIVFNASVTTSGTAGYIASTLPTDTVRLIYQAIGEWHVTSSQGNITVV